LLEPHNSSQSSSSSSSLAQSDHSASPSLAFLNSIGTLFHKLISQSASNFLLKKDEIIKRNNKEVRKHRAKVGPDQRRAQ